MPDSSKPEISVVIPLYQVVQYLKDALESVLAQTYFQNHAYEVLLIVDGECEDVSSKIPKALEPHLKILKIEHRGVSGARNYGIEKSSAQKWIAFLDADDIWLPEKIERQAKVMEKHSEAGGVYTNSFWIGKTGKALRRTQMQQYGSLPSGFIFPAMLERDYIITSSLLVRKDAVGIVGGFDTALEVCEDWEWKIRLAKKFPIISLGEPLLYYRLHAAGSHYKCERMLECGYQVFDSHLPSSEKSLNGQIEKWRANIPLNLAGSWLYIDQTALARKYMREAFLHYKWNPRLYLMYGLSLFPKSARDFLLHLRDRIPFLP